MWLRILGNTSPSAVSSVQAHLAAVGCNGREIAQAHLAAIGCKGLIKGLTKEDLRSWPTLTSRGEPPDGEKNNHEKSKYTISAFPALPLRVGRAVRTILVPRA